MTKRKPQAIVSVADGAGGLAPVVDLRFDSASWPINVVVPAEIARHWFAYLDAECSERGWHSHGITQLDADENSGTFLVSTGVAGQLPTLQIVWERPRGGSIEVRARPGGSPTLSLDAAQAFFDAVRSRIQTGATVRLHRRAHLVYEGLPWRVELWLGSDLRLGPPSRHASWLIAPQVIIVDADVEGISRTAAASNFGLMLRELAVFLAALLGIRATPERSGWAGRTRGMRRGRPPTASCVHSDT